MRIDLLQQDGATGFEGVRCWLDRRHFETAKNGTDNDSANDDVFPPPEGVQKSYSLTKRVLHFGVSHRWFVGGDTHESLTTDRLRDCSSRYCLTAESQKLPEGTECKRQRRFFDEEYVAGAQRNIGVAIAFRFSQVGAD